MKLLKYVTWNALFFSTIYFGLFLGNEGATNLAIFIGWTLSVMGITFAFVDEVKDGLRKKGRAVPSWLDQTLDFMVIGVFVYHGYIVLGIFFFAHTCCLASIYEGETKDNSDTALEDKQ